MSAYSEMECRMKKAYLLCIAWVCQANALFSDNPISVENISTTSETPAQAKDFEGFHIDIGLNLGIQQTKAELNQYCHSPLRVTALTCGSTVSLGFQQRVCGNCFAGIEVGAEFTLNSKPTKIGGYIRSDSLLAAVERETYSLKENILRQMFDNIGSTALNVTYLAVPGHGHAETIMTMDVYRQFGCI